MSTDYTFFKNLAVEVDIPKDGILSRTLYSDDKLKVIIFGFDKGQELSKHTAASAAVVHILKGEAHLAFGDVSTDVAEGAWVHMQPQLEHAIYAKTPVTMLLLMIE
jgi:quercetin dioxygenase-like cupin family protein